MDSFYEGFIACASLLGALCAFIYWMFNITEKRLEQKLETMSVEISRIATELKEERLARDSLYSFVLNNNKK